MEKGRLEDVGQLSRTIHRQIRVNKVVAFKPMWWLSGMNSNRNNLTGEVLAYEALHGAGGAVVHLRTDYGANKLIGGASGLTWIPYTDSDGLANNKVTSIDEELKQLMKLQLLKKMVLLYGSLQRRMAQSILILLQTSGLIPHARRVGHLLYLSGVAPRQPATNCNPGGL